VNATGFAQAPGKTKGVSRRAYAEITYILLGYHIQRIDPQFYAVISLVESMI
jgi:hypothetical protein